MQAEFRTSNSVLFGTTKRRMGLSRPCPSILPLLFIGAIGSSSPGGSILKHFSICSRGNGFRVISLARSTKSSLEGMALSRRPPTQETPSRLDLHKLLERRDLHESPFGEVGHYHTPATIECQSRLGDDTTKARSP